MKISVIGAGPAAAYFIKEGLGRNPFVVFDLFEKTEKLLGYLRKGVAPDQHALRKTIPALEAVFSDRRVKLHTGAELGVNIDVKKLDSYSAVVLGTGARPRKLTIPGNEHVIYADRVMEEISENRPVKLSGKVAIIGNGNVSLDVARMLLHSKRLQAYTNSLEKVSVEQIDIVGRSSPETSTFTNSVLSEVLAESVRLQVSDRVKGWICTAKEDHSREARRRAQLLSTKEKGPKTLQMIFWESPIKITKTNSKKNLEITDKKSKYQLTTQTDTGAYVTREYDAIIAAIGYTSPDYKNILKDVAAPVYEIGWAKTNGRGTLSDAYKSAMEAAEQLFSKSK